MPKPKAKAEGNDAGKRGSHFGAVISDPRFSRIHSDARFAIQSKKQTKLKVDDRFQVKREREGNCVFEGCCF